MSFKYINPGFISMGDSMYVGSSQVDDKDKKYSRTGTYIRGYFQQSIPNNEKEVWLKYDCYYSGATWEREQSMRITLSTGKEIKLSWHYQQIRFFGTLNGNYVVINVGDIIGKAFNILLHAKVNDNMLELQLFVDGVNYYDSSCSCDANTTFSNFEINNPQEALFYSNIIMSSEKIGLSEQVVKIPTITSLNQFTENNDDLWEAEQVSKWDFKPIDDYCESIGIVPEKTGITGALIVNKKIYRDGDGLDKVSYGINDTEIKNRYIPTSNKFKLFGSTKHVCSTEEFKDCKFSCSVYED